MKRFSQDAISLGYQASERSFWRAFIFLLAFWAWPAHSQQAYQSLGPNPMGPVADLTCEVRRTQACTSFFNQFPSDFREKFGLECPDADEGSLFRTTTVCSGLTLASGLSAWQTLGQETKAKIAQKVPFLLQKFGPKLLPFLFVLGSVATIYSITDILSYSIQQDQKCFENRDQKQATIDFLAVTSRHLLERTQGLLDEVQTRQLRLAEAYQQSKFVEQLTCRQLSEIVLMQKRKQDEILGKLMAAGKLASDPRKELVLTDEESRRAKLLLENMGCLSSQKRLELLCALGNTALGGVQFAKFLGSVGSVRALPSVPEKNVAPVRHILPKPTRYIPFDSLKKEGASLAGGGTASHDIYIADLNGLLDDLERIRNELARHNIIPGDLQLKVTSNRAVVIDPELFEAWPIGEPHEGKPYWYRYLGKAIEIVRRRLKDGS